MLFIGCKKCITSIKSVSVPFLYFLGFGFEIVSFCLMHSPFSVLRHRRAIQKSRGSKVRRAEGTMESEPGAPASTSNTTGTTTGTTTATTASSSSTTSCSSTAVISSSSTSSTTITTTTAAPTNSISSSSSSSSSGVGVSSNTSSTSSSTTTAGRQAVPQISVYSGMPDRQTVQVSSVMHSIVCDAETWSDDGHMQVSVLLLYYPLLVLIALLQRSNKVLDSQPRPFSVEFACSLYIHMGFLHGLFFPPIVQRH